jgi:hypothetical protein
LQVSSQEISSIHHHAGARIRQALQSFKLKVTKTFSVRAKRNNATEDDNEATAHDGERCYQWDVIHAITKETLKQCFKHAVKARLKWPVTMSGYTRGSYHFVVMLRAYDPDSMIDIVKMERKCFHKVVDIVLSHPVLSTDAADGFVLQHSALDLQNTLVDEPGKVTGILN